MDPVFQQNSNKVTMRIIPFKLLILCILLPPLMYLMTVSFLETYLQGKYDKGVNNVYLSDMNDILNGLTTLKSSINTSIETYLRNNLFLTTGGILDIRVTTKGGAILYPATYQNSTVDNLTTDPVKLAEKNFALLNEGTEVQVGVKIKHTSFLALGLLLFYELLFLGGLYQYYRKVRSSNRREELEKSSELNRLQELENQRLEQISQLSKERESLLSDYDQLQSTFEKEKSQLEKTEEDLFIEIETLERKLTEIDILKEQIQELESIHQVAVKQKEKAADRLGKRFKALYKNIDITSRALESLVDMNEDMSLKAEEVIHQLNSDSALVPVKRKVFTKKGNTTAFEVTFAYNGRLYFRKSKDNRVEVLTVGTKNTQQKDLTYIDSL
ncbi:MAG: hypothetical protein C4518_09790 [Desulfobacteraceae bacterium]|nr:MAG: hypothetical protein C4518_09790 [Desulfobacteraceae bacterium]